MVFNVALLLKLLASFLIGSVPFAVVAMWGSGTDIRDVGSGNPGFNNVLRFSKQRALVALIGDFGKGYLAVWLFYDPSQFINMGWLFGMVAVFGHCYTPWLRFSGGKGVATSAGAMMGLYPAVAGSALGFFVVARLVGSRFKLNERGAWASLLTWVFFTAVIHATAGMPHTKYSLLMTMFLVWRHKSNIGRMLGR